MKPHANRSRPRVDLAAQAPMAFSVADASRLLGVSRATIYRELAARRITAVKIGRRTVVPREAIEDYIAAQPGFATRRSGREPVL